MKGDKMGKDTTGKFSWRSFVSVLTAASFVGMVFTGVILFIVPPGRIANWTGWTILALTKHQWVGLHDWLSIVFVIASAFHLYLNWKAFVSYFKSKVTRAFALRSEWALAMLVFVAVLVGTVAGVRPFSTLMAWNENIKHSWDSPRQRAPIPHAELLTFNELAEQVPDIALETMLANVEKHGIEVESPDVVIGELAEASGLTPARLYDIALGQAGGSGGCDEEHAGGGGGQRRGGSGGGSGRGFGQLTLSQYCVEAGLDVDTAVDKLKQQGFQAQAEMTIRQIADSVGAHPSEIRGVIDAPQH
ncbi:MAG TPA: DUF4405 domain-containing protein [Phycisphaerales bacterium]|nr:DUF4405 domain-containing protein [Phycisphaerales bacterium]